MKLKAVSGIMLTLLLMGMFFASFGVSETLANPTVRFYVKMPPEGYIPGIPPGSPLIVEVWIDSPPGAGIVGWALSLHWDPSVLDLGYSFDPDGPGPLPPIYYDIVEGPWLSDWCAAYPWPYGTSFLKGAIDKEAGTVTLPACMINSWLELPPGSGADGTGCLAYFYFTSLSETGYSPLYLFDCEYGTTEGVFPVDVAEYGHYNQPPVLTVESTPIDGINFTIDATTYTTNRSVELPEGNYTVTMPSTWMVGTDQYNFLKWEDDSTNRVRTINLTANTTITATYELTKEYTLTVNSIPITGIDFTVDGTTHTTNWAGPLLEGPYTVAMPSTWMIDTSEYYFRRWEDDSTNPVRDISLTSNMTITATYGPPGGPYYIRSDGSVDPPTAPIQRDGNVYTFTSTIYDEIVVERDNIVVDGAGYALQGTGAMTSEGMYLSERSNVTIRNMEIKAFWYGIYLHKSSNNTISGNNITANDEAGIELVSSSSNSVSANNITANNHWAILFSKSSSNSISGNNVKNSYYGIGIISHSSSNSISANTITNNSWGIHLNQASNNSIYTNNIANNGWVGIGCFYFSFNNNISRNNITGNINYGIRISESTNNTISENIITNNEYGIAILWGSNNSVYHNNFINNTFQAYAQSSVNVWDDGYPSGGNYWSDHVCTGNPSDGSEPYNIDANNIDHYPFQDPNGWLLGLAPVASFTCEPPTPYVGDAVTFNASASYDPDGTIVGCAWDFGDGMSATDMIVNHAYSEEGTFTITLTVTDNDGLTGTATTNITVIHRVLSIKLCGEHDYSCKEEIKIRLVALVRDVNTMEPVLDADVAIEIYGPDGTLWVSDVMVERLVGTGIHEWESDAIICMLKELHELEDGVYLVYAQASCQGGPVASDILEFHIDPPSEGTVPLPYYAIAFILLVGVAGTILLRKLRQTATQQPKIQK
jgi:parallel beta-helix repeat protein